MLKFFARGVDQPVAVVDAAPTITPPLHERAARLLDTGLVRLDARIGYLEGQISMHQAELDKTLDMRGRYAKAVGTTTPPATVRQNGIAIDEDGTYRPDTRPGAISIKAVKQDVFTPDVAAKYETESQPIGDLTAALVDGVAEAMAGPLLTSEPRHYNPLAGGPLSIVKKK